MKDIFGKMTEEMCEKITALSVEELTEERKAALEALKAQRAEIEAPAHTLIKNTIAICVKERDTRVAEAHAAELHWKGMYDALQNRTASSERLLQEADKKVKSSAAEAERAREKTSKIEAADVRTKELWAEALATVLSECTLKARKEEKVADATKPWRQRQRTAAERAWTPELQAPGPMMF